LHHGRHGTPTETTEAKRRTRRVGFTRLHRLLLLRRLKRNTIGEKLFDLANLSAAVLIFGKFLDPERVPDWALWIGGFTFVALYVVGSILVYFGGD
jgi:hypothetical protein